jgi:hypothetical protein
MEARNPDQYYILWGQGRCSKELDGYQDEIGGVASTPQTARSKPRFISQPARLHDEEQLPRLGTTGVPHEWPVPQGCAHAPGRETRGFFFAQQFYQPAFA